MLSTSFSIAFRSFAISAAIARETEQSEVKLNKGSVR
jgi:hypothetical protein